MKGYFFKQGRLLPVWSLAILMSFFVESAIAKTFVVGDTVMVAYPANNIKDDAYIIGLVRKIAKNGDYQVSVLDYVRGHDYGLSCVPIRENEMGEATNEVAWDVWSDRTQLFGKGMQYVVPKENVRKLQSGQMDFIERNNLYVTYSRWKNNAPIMTLDQFDEAIEKSQTLGLAGFVPALKLAKQERAAYYQMETGRPYWPYEVVPLLNDLLGNVVQILKKDPALDKLWRNKAQRDWKNKPYTTEHYFLVDALDKIKFDATYEAAEDGLEKVDPKVLKQFKDRLKFLGAKL